MATETISHSERAVQVNIEIMRAFVRLRQLLQLRTEIADRIREG